MQVIEIFPDQVIQNILDEFHDEISSSEQTLIKIHAGIYNQRVHICGQNIRIKGLGKVILNNALGANELGHNQTFHTATFLCEGENIKIDNLTILNSAGQGDKVGQSIALYLNGDNFYVSQCTIISYQDTLCLGPVILKNRDGTVTSNPVMKKKLRKARYIFHECIIQGDIDFIFGGGSALFLKCTINCTSNKLESYLCAPCTEKTRKLGFVFIHCKIDNDDSSECYLGRPWRNYAKSYFISCKLSQSLRKNGWHFWGVDPTSGENTDFRTYKCDVKEQDWTFSSGNIDNDLMDLIQKYFNIEYL